MLFYKKMYTRRVFVNFITNMYFFKPNKEENDGNDDQENIDMVHEMIICGTPDGNIHDFVPENRQKIAMDNFIQKLNETYNVQLVKDDIYDIFFYSDDYDVHQLIPNLIIKIFNKFNSQRSFFVEDKSKNAHDPYEFYLLKDKIDDIQYSTRSPYKFSMDRTSPIVVIDDYVGLSEEDEDHHLDLIQRYNQQNEKLVYFNVLNNDGMDDSEKNS